MDGQLIVFFLWRLTLCLDKRAGRCLLVLVLLAFALVAHATYPNLQNLSVPSPGADLTGRI